MLGLRLLGSGTEAEADAKVKFRKEAENRSPKTPKIEVEGLQNVQKERPENMWCLLG